MASNITLSAGVRQNLLSLQSTAELMSTTQNRLATGKKVNSALDNPTNFFTSQSLQSRAGDMSALLDNMTSGVKTLEAADNGLSAITKTVESMQSTLRQARQDKSFKTDSYTVGLPTTPAGTEKLTLAGGAIGATGIDVALTKLGGSTPATAGVKTGGAFTAVDFTAATATSAVLDAGTFATVDLSHTTASATAGTVTGGTYSPIDLSLTNTLTLSIDVDGAGSPQSITLDNTITAADNTAVTGAELATAISSQLTGATATFNGTGIVITSGTTGDASEVDITAVGGTAASGSGLTVTSDAGSDAVVADSLAFTLKVDGTTQAITLNNSITAVDKSAVTAAELASAINTQFGSSVASVGTGGNLVFSSATTGTSSTVDVTGLALAGAATSGGIANDDADGVAAGAAKVMSFTLQRDAETAVSISINLADVTAVGNNDSSASASELAGIINTKFGSTVATVGTGGELVFTSTTTGAASNMTVGGFTTNTTSTGGIANGAGTVGQAAGPGTTPVAKSVDELVAAINGDTSLKGKVRASNDSGKLRIENLSTAELTVTGASETTGAVDGSTSVSEIGGNSVRSNLVKQFNELRDQLNKLADDASFNGVNLLRGDMLKLTFNETGTSTIEIQAKDEAGQERPINTDTLSIQMAEDADFDSDTSIDGMLDTLQGALGTLRSQASSFGSNLSIVENRTDFTKNMINTLQTGADALVLADTNEEAANMLALQTRQQLSSTALSMASQADQAVLRLF